MSQSTDAILCYGIDFGEDLPWEDFDEESDNEDAAIEKNPLGAMACGYVDSIEGVTLIGHCSDGCRMYILAIADSEMRAYRGDPKTVEHIDIKLDWDEKLLGLLKKHDIETDAKPAWLLASDWT